MKKNLKVGERIVHKTYGAGTVKEIDKNNIEFKYFIEFDEGCRSWFSVWQTNKEVEHDKEEGSR